MSLGIGGWIAIVLGSLIVISMVSCIIGGIRERNATEATMKATITAFLELGLDPNTPLTEDEEEQVKFLKIAIETVKIKDWGAEVGSWESEMIAARLRGDAEDLENQAVSKREEAGMRQKLVGILPGRTRAGMVDFGEADVVFGVEAEGELEDHGHDEKEKGEAKKGEVVVGEVEEQDDGEKKYQETQHLYDAEVKVEAEEIVDRIEVVTTMRKERAAPKISKSEEYFALYEFDESSEFEDETYGRFEVRGRDNFRCCDRDGGSECRSTNSVE